MNKHVLYYIHNYPGYGGIEKVTTILANHFVENEEWEVTIISFSQKYTDELINELDSNVIFLKMPNSTNLDSEENRNFLFKFLQTNTIDVIIFQDSYANIHKILFEVNKSFNTPIITVEHNSPFNALVRLKNHQKTLSYFRPPKETIHKLLYPYYKWKTFKSDFSRRRYKYNKSKYYILLSDLFFREFRDITKITKTDKLLAINNPITITNDPIDFRMKKKQLLFVGRMDPTKNVKLLIQIWQNLYNDFPDWEFVIVGDGTEKESLHDYVESNNIQRISFEGFKTNVVPYYKDASIFCMASIFEGLPLTLTESILMGVVPVAFDTFASIKDIIKNGVNGFLIKPWNIDEYTDCLKMLMKNEKQINIISRQAQLSSDRFALSNIGKQWVRIVNNIEN